MTIRISVTDLDSWRYFKDSEMELEDFLKRLRREDPPTRQMLAGSALHKILEQACSGNVLLNEEIPTATSDGFTFRFASDIELPRLPVCELKGELRMLTAASVVDLVGVVDGIDGTIYDHKLTERFDAERYADSYQWRSYLVMFGAQRFTYNVFVGKEELREWVIYDFHRFSFYAYAGIEDDVIREVGELAEFVAKYLPERVAA